MKKLLIAAAVALVTSQANATTYNITYSFERDATVVPETLFYLASKALTTALPDPSHLLGGPSTFMFPGGAIPVYGTGTVNTVTGAIVLGGIDIEIMIPSGSIGYTGYTQTLSGSFTGNTYNQTANALSWTTFVCEAGTETGNPCVSGAVDTGRVDPDGIVFSALGIGGTGSFVQKDAVLPFTETRMNFTIVSEVAEVPVPAAAWLFGSALLGLAGIGRKRS